MVEVHLMALEKYLVVILIKKILIARAELIKYFNQKKQNIYLNSDIFLQLSNSEGNSYATLDALLCGVVVVSSNVGLFYKDVPEDCFVKLDWTRNNDVKYVEEKLKYAWEHREELGRKGREWYMKNCRLENWISRMRNVIKYSELCL